MHVNVVCVTISHFTVSTCDRYDRSEAASGFSFQLNVVNVYLKLYRDEYVFLDGRIFYLEEFIVF